MSETGMTINIGTPKNKAFYAGVAAGRKAADQADAIISSSERENWFWMIVGVELATSGVDGEDSELLALYLQGVATQKPAAPLVTVTIDRQPLVMYAEDEDDSNIRNTLETFLATIGGRIGRGEVDEGKHEHISPGGLHVGEYTLNLF